MANYKIPIIEKLYEAYSAIADGRITFEADRIFVESSDYSKKYTITKTNNTYISNDNMSYWKQTIGYPILAVMMLEGNIKFNNEVAKCFAGINWKNINTKYKNDYVKTGEIILSQLAEKRIDISWIKTETESVYAEVKNLNLPYYKSKIFPPK